MNDAREPTIEDLIPFGYAPGEYFLFKCSSCDETLDWVDKQASTCRKCATRLWKESLNNETQSEPDTVDAALAALRLSPHTQTTYRKIRRAFRDLRSELTRQEEEIERLKAKLAQIETEREYTDKLAFDTFTRLLPTRAYLDTDQVITSLGAELEWCIVVRNALSESQERLALEVKNLRQRLEAAP